MEEYLIELKGQISEQLSPLIDSDYIFIDLPYYTNIGDALIWKGTEDFLSCLQYKCLYRSSYFTFQHQEIDENVIILMQGGGNFGDLYPQHQEFRKSIIKQYPNNRIIILPQTVYYQGFRAIREDSAVLRSHNKLTICARDKYSYKFLKKYNFTENIILVPDMAFCINQDYLDSLSLPEEDRTLFMKRIDKELSESSMSELPQGQCEVHDWLTMEGHDDVTREFYNKAYEHPLLPAQIDEMAINIFLPHLLDVGVKQISQYRTVVSTRLHGAILSTILGKRCVVLDNSYGKNSHFYNTWLSEFPNVSMKKTKVSYSTLRQIKLIIIRLLTWYDTISVRNHSRI